MNIKTTVYLRKLELMSNYPTVFKPSNDIEIFSFECPEYFGRFLDDLMNEIDGTWKEEQKIENSELSGFIEGKNSLSISRIFGHVERLLMVLQAAQLVGPNAMNEMEEFFASGDAAMPEGAFWDPAAYSGWLDDSNYGSLLSQQDLPDIAINLLVEIIDYIGLELNEDDEDALNVELYHFHENHIPLSPSDITCQFGRLLIKYLNK